MSVASRSSLHALAKIFSNILIHKPNVPTPLGRWNLCENRNINLVIDNSNEDHCGTCSSHTLNDDIKVDIAKNENVINNINEDKNVDNEILSYDYICLISNCQEK